VLVKLLVRQPPGLPDPFLRPCTQLHGDRQQCMMIWCMTCVGKLQSAAYYVSSINHVPVN